MYDKILFKKWKKIKGFIWLKYKNLVLWVGFFILFSIVYSCIWFSNIEWIVSLDLEWVWNIWLDIFNLCWYKGFVYGNYWFGVMCLLKWWIIGVFNYKVLCCIFIKFRFLWNNGWVRIVNIKVSRFLRWI